VKPILQFALVTPLRRKTFTSMERNMKCAVGFCGHCLFGPTFICKDGPVFRFDRVERWLSKREI
jgi:NAD(P)H-flavin reductase